MPAAGCMGRCATRPCTPDACSWCVTVCASPCWSDADAYRSTVVSVVDVAPNSLVLDDGVPTCRLSVPDDLRDALIDALMEGATILESRSAFGDGDGDDDVEAWQACARALLDGLIAEQRVVVVPATGTVYVKGTVLGRALGAIGKGCGAEASAWVALCAQFPVSAD